MLHIKRIEVLELFNIGDYIVHGRMPKFHSHSLEIQFDLLTKQIEIFLDPTDHEN